MRIILDVVFQLSICHGFILVVPLIGFRFSESKDLSVDTTTRPLVS